MQILYCFKSLIALDIERVIKGCIKKERRSQDELVRIFAPSLMAVCKRYCQDSRLAGEALQNTFINVFKYIEGYSGEGSFEGWLKRIAVNCSLTLMKKESKIRVYEKVEEETMLQTDIPDVYDRMEVKEIMELIGKLPEVQYLVFNMKVVEGYSHREIAEILKIKESTSRSNLTRARNNMIRLMTKNNGELKIDN